MIEDREADGSDRIFQGAQGEGVLRCPLSNTQLAAELPVLLEVPSKCASAQAAYLIFC